MRRVLSPEFGFATPSRPTPVRIRNMTSWGGVLRADHPVVDLRAGASAWGEAGSEALADVGSWLPYGNGRSYGDSNLNPGGGLFNCRTMSGIRLFDAASGVVDCDAGVLLDDILDLAVPQGWFLPVVPGTCHVTVAGAIANDVHGKNHHSAGSFGNHVLSFELQRSDGQTLQCSPTGHSEWFSATIGGLGLTGIITSARLQLRRVDCDLMDVESIRFRSLDEFFELSAASAASWEYTVAWIDCAFAGRRLGRGLFSRANHAAAPVQATATPKARARRMPFTPPVSLVNPLTLKAFNTLYFHRQREDHVRRREHFRPFFFPLDALLEWNRMYGPKGFFQYQCVVPPEGDARRIRQLLEAIAASGMGSFLAVLKQFGDTPSRGLLSFPMPGTTLALDFPNRGQRLHRLFEALDRIVLDAGGRLYPAKDGRMDAAMFRAGSPRLSEFLPFVDPCLSSAFWRRVAAS